MAFIWLYWIGPDRSDRTAWSGERGTGSEKDLEPRIKLESPEAFALYVVVLLTRLSALTILLVVKLFETVGPIF